MDLTHRFLALYAGVVYDAMRFDIKYDKPFVVTAEIKNCVRSTQGNVHFGPAVTCKGQNVTHADHIDDDVRLNMFEAFTPGCIQVIDCGGNEDVAHFGDISGKLAAKHGAVAAVISGYTRDLRLIDEDQFPVYCRGTMPVDAFGRWQIVEYQCPVALPGVDGIVMISPGDYLFCDDDGVILVPHSIAEEVCRCAEKRLKDENIVRQEVTKCDDLIALRERIGRW